MLKNEYYVQLSYGTSSNCYDCVICDSVDLSHTGALIFYDKADDGKLVVHAIYAPGEWLHVGREEPE